MRCFCFRFGTLLTKNTNDRVPIHLLSPILEVITNAATEPSAPPVGVQVDATGGGVQIKATVPLDTGGTAITAFQVLIEGNLPSWTKLSTSTPFEASVDDVNTIFLNEAPKSYKFWIFGLKEATVYTMLLRAKNIKRVGGNSD